VPALASALGWASSPWAVWLPLGGAAILFLGSLLPWASLLGASISGTTSGVFDFGGGLVTLGIAIVVAALVLPITAAQYQQYQRQRMIGALALSAIALIIVGWNIVDIGHAASGSGGLASAGFGLYVAALGSVAATVGSAGLLAVSQSRAHP
jgi:hypothetical protein